MKSTGFDMAAALCGGSCDDMFDTTLKPRILNYLLSDHLPCEGDIFPDDFVDLQKVIDVVKAFELVSEKFPEEASSRLIEDWAAAVDAWCERLVSLVTCSRARSVWLGTYLTGMTCQECSTDRFSASYAVWLEALLSNIQAPSGSISVRAASCASITDLLIRLGRCPNLKEEGTLHAERVIQPLLELLDKDRSEAVLEGAVRLLCTLMDFFPEAVRLNFDSVEAAVLQKIVSGRSGSAMLKMYAHCLALLPKAKGDEESWTTMIQDLLTSINIHLNEVFYSLEDGKDSSFRIENWGTSKEASIQEARRSKELLMSIVPTLMLSCRALLTYPYPFQVIVPVDQLLKLVERVLKMKASGFPDSSLVMKTMQQELMCSELPILHLNSLDLLSAIIKGACSQLLPFAESIIGFLKAYFEKCTLPIIRIKVYSVIRTWLICINAGGSLQLAEEIINNAFVDLGSAGNRSRKELCGADLKSTIPEVLLHSGYKRRKHVYSTGHSEGQKGGKSMEVELLNTSTSRGLKIAALEALETLLTVDAAVISEYLRADIDSLLINLALLAYDEKSANKEENDFVPPSEPGWEDYRLAALRALLASLLTQSCLNPRYLFQGLELFRKGRGDAEKIALFCAHSLLVLEMLMHPTEFSDDRPYASQDSCEEGIEQGLPENIYAGGHENKYPIRTPIAMGMDDSSENDEDELYDILLGFGKATGATSSNPGEKNEKSEETSIAEILKAVKGYQVDYLLIDGDDFPEIDEPGQAVHVYAGTSTGSGAEYKKASSKTDEFIPASYDIKPRKDVLAIITDINKKLNDNSAATTVPGKAEEPETGLVIETSADSYHGTVDKDSKSDVKPARKWAA